MDEEPKETSAAIASLFSVLESIIVTPERITQNQWKLVGKNSFKNPEINNKNEVSS